MQVRGVPQLLLLFQLMLHTACRQVDTSSECGTG